MQSSKPSSPKKIEIYTTDYCPYCRRAKELFIKKGVQFEEIDATNEEIREAMILKTNGARTVPQIFVDGEFVPGGCDGLFEKERNGQLDALLGIVKK
jgi:glutaredoxin 3